jgi:hypothetical protein
MKTVDREIDRCAHHCPYCDRPVPAAQMACGYCAIAEQIEFAALRRIVRTKESLLMSMEEKMREIVLRVAWSYLGTLYRWGGDDPSGFDCSGLAVECLQSVGLVHRNHDHTAQSLFALWSKGRVAVPGPGDLVFWANAAGKIIHVEIAIDAELAIGASGGGSGTLSESDAIRQNAYVKIRPIASRAGFAGAISPYGCQPI